MTFNHGTPIPASLFTWKHGTGVAEASDFGPTPFEHQVWPDACDVGFTLAGRTGELITFVEAARIDDPEGELVARVYRSIDRRTGRVDESPFSLTIKIFND
jgi:hypothetical protein